MTYNDDDDRIERWFINHHQTWSILFFAISYFILAITEYNYARVRVHFDLINKSSSMTSREHKKKTSKNYNGEQLDLYRKYMNIE